MTLQHWLFSAKAFLHEGIDKKHRMYLKCILNALPGFGNAFCVYFMSRGVSIHQRLAFLGLFYPSVASCCTKPIEVVSTHPTPNNT